MTKTVLFFPGEPTRILIKNHKFGVGAGMLWQHWHKNFSEMRSKGSYNSRLILCCTAVPSVLEYIMGNIGQAVLFLFLDPPACVYVYDCTPLNEATIRNVICKYFYLHSITFTCTLTAFSSHNKQSITVALNIYVTDFRSNWTWNNTAAHKCCWHTHKVWPDMGRWRDESLTAWGI